MTINRTVSDRGFVSYNFTDRYGEACSLQRSSLATEPAIWFGANDLKVKAFPSMIGTGWDTIKVEEMLKVLGWSQVSANTRMHLTQQQVYELLPILAHFAMTGEFPSKF